MVGSLRKMFCSTEEREVGASRRYKVEALEVREER